MIPIAPAPVPGSPAAAAASPVPASERRVIDVRRIGLAVLLSLAGTSLLSLVVGLGVLATSSVALIVPLAQLIPMIVVLLVRRREGPWWRALGWSVPSWPRLGALVVVAVALFALVPGLRALLALALGAAPAADALPVATLLLTMVLVLLMQSITAIGEESAWRGWMQDQLSPLGFWGSSLLIGGIWALWHLPIVVALGLNLLESVVYLGTILAVAPLLSALSVGSGTVWAAVIGHGLLNSVRVGLDQNLVGQAPGAGAWVVEIAGWALWILAALAVTVFFGARRTGPAVAAVRA